MNLLNSALDEDGLADDCRDCGLLQKTSNFLVADDGLLAGPAKRLQGFGYGDGRMDVGSLPFIKACGVYYCEVGDRSCRDRCLTQDVL